MLSDRLKLETAAEHQALEAEMMPLLRGATAAIPYAQLLRGMHRFLAPLEAGAHRNMPAHWLSDREQRRGTEWMAKDLKALGEAVPPAGKEEAPQVTSEADAWGALYLLEGSTLGGQMITRILQKQLPGEAHHLAYFGGYGAKTGSMWKAFKNQLNAWGEAHPEAQDETVAFAKGTFTNFQKSLSEYKTGL